MESNKFFIYCRKSSEDDSKQILSIEAQVDVLTEFARKNNYKVIETLSESGTAFKPGREIFSKMMARIYSGEADGVIVWQTNRLSRNPVDAGAVIYALDSEQLEVIVTPQRFYKNTPTDKFLLGLELSVSKKDSDDKSENVKRGNKYKYINKATWIGPAKIGYLNFEDPISKGTSIIVDTERFPLLQSAYKQILSWVFTPAEALYFLNKDGFRTRATRKTGGLPLAKSTFYRFLADQFYYGLMVRNIEGVRTEVVGSHTPMITKAEFDQMQIILGKKGHPRYIKKDILYKPLLRCGECGGAITAEIKTQVICTKCKEKFHKGDDTDCCPHCQTKLEDMKNPKALVYVYYHCFSDKSSGCSRGSVTLEKLEAAVDIELQKYKFSDKFQIWALKYLSEVNDIEQNNQNI